MRKKTWLATGAAVAALATAAFVASHWQVIKHYERPRGDAAVEFEDDRWSRREEAPPPFVASRTHPVAVGERGAWLVNRSAARFELDVEIVFPDSDGALLRLHPSYTAAVKAAGVAARVLPSVNVISGKAKQIDDGLCAAMDLVCMNGSPGSIEGSLSVVRRLHEAVPATSPAAAFLGAALEIAHESVGDDNADARRRFVQRFEADELRSKPVGFATWSAALTDAFRFRRFLDQEFDAAAPVVRDIAAALARDTKLRDDYARLLSIAEGLHGRPACAPIANGASGDAALFPRRTSPQLEFLRRLFPHGPPRGSSLMHELVRRVLSGECDLAPAAGAGWLDRQVHALETLLVPGRGEERVKLILSSSYKQRMLEAFQATLTKTYETHDPYATLKGPRLENVPPPPPKDIAPTMRAEPAPTYFLRTARAYAFLLTFLRSGVGEVALARTHGLRAEGARDMTLLDELTWTRSLFYGLHLVACDDLGMPPFLADGESGDEAACRTVAIAWLGRAFDDPDLATDTRVAFAVQADADATRLWGTLGVRMAKLRVSWFSEEDVKIRPAQGNGEWRPAEWSDSSDAHYLIPVDEFAEFELPRGRVLSREELREICDDCETREEVIEALRD